MKKTMIYICCLFGFLFFTACENDPMLYEGEPGGVAGIYFQMKTGNVQCVDSLVYSFQNEPLSVEEHVIPIPVYILGEVKDYPRSFLVKVAGGTAIEGEDYVALEKEYVLPAHQPSTYLPLILKRSARLLKEQVDLVVELKENEHFKLLLPTVKDGVSGHELDATRFKVVYSELIELPIMWTITYASTYFGDWSVKKFRLINDMMGWQTADWSNFSGPVAPGKYGYAATLLQRYLQKQADKKDPVYEEDGKTYMQLGKAYNVDYSGLENAGEQGNK